MLNENGDTFREIVIADELLPLRRVQSDVTELN